jgi:hypothetical protein
MEKENSGNSKMENIFYAALALHVAGKPISKENIRVVLRAAGTSVDESALDIIAAFIESLKASPYEKESVIDSRIIKLLPSVLSLKKVPMEQLGALLGELARSIPPDMKTREAILDKSTKPEAGGRLELPKDSGKVEHIEAINGDARVAAVEVPAKESVTSTQCKGRYVYGITAGGREVRLGPIGIEGSEVYTVTYQDLGAIVHSCPTEPYQSLDDETVKGWVKAHQSVLDAAKEQFSTIIPLGFDTILKPGDDSISPDQVVRDWLKKDCDRFHAVISKIEGKDEYGVQVSYIPAVISKHISEQSEEVNEIRDEMAKKSPGIAYIYKQKLEKTIKAEMERLADSWFKDFYNRVNKHTDDIIVEKTRKLDKDKVMLLNLSCLVAKEKVDGLGEELEKINNMEGFFVHFSGPWPPYSFVAKPIVAAGKEGSNGPH